MMSFTARYHLPVYSQDCLHPQENDLKVPGRNTPICFFGIRENIYIMVHSGGQETIQQVICTLLAKEHKMATGGLTHQPDKYWICHAVNSNRLITNHFCISWTQLKNRTLRNLAIVTRLLLALYTTNAKSRCMFHVQFQHIGPTNLRLRQTCKDKLVSSYLSYKVIFRFQFLI